MIDDLLVDLYRCGRRPVRRTRHHCPTKCRHIGEAGILWRSRCTLLARRCGWLQLTSQILGPQIGARIIWRRLRIDLDEEATVLAECEF